MLGEKCDRIVGHQIIMHNNIRESPISFCAIIIIKEHIMKPRSIISKECSLIALYWYKIYNHIFSSSFEYLNIKKQKQHA